MSPRDDTLGIAVIHSYGVKLFPCRVTAAYRAYVHPCGLIPFVGMLMYGASASLQYQMLASVAALNHPEPMAFRATAVYGTPPIAIIVHF